MDRRSTSSSIVIQDMKIEGDKSLEGGERCTTKARFATLGSSDVSWQQKPQC